MKKHITLCAFLLAQQLSGSAQTYCTPTGLNCSAGDGPNVFQMTGEQSTAIAYSSNACNADAYYDQSGTTGVSAYVGNTYSFDIKSGFDNQVLTVWVDLNNDGVFQTAERLVIEQAFDSTMTTLSMTIPASATPGTYRMRVMGVGDRFGGGGNGGGSGGLIVSPLAGTYPMDPCNLDSGGNPIYIYGKTLDFFINVMATPLPITLADFSAVSAAGVVQLKWNTFSESQNKGFYVEYSQEGTQWNTIGFVASQADKGESNAELEYKFIHHTPCAGQNFYRLRQVDFNGQQNFSPVRKVSFNDNEHQQFFAFPNPVSKWLTIDGLQAGERIRVFSATGNLVIDQNIPPVSNKLDMSSLPAGLYLVRIENGCGKVRVEKVQKINE